MIVSGCDGSVDLQVTEDTLDPVTLTVEFLVVVDQRFSVRLRRNDGFYAPPLQVGADCVGVVSFVGQQCLGLLLREIDQFFVSLAVVRFARREVEGNRSASGITETMNFTGEPAPRAAKSSSMNPPFPPAAETRARTK